MNEATMNEATSTITQAKFATKVFVRTFPYGFDEKLRRFATSRPGRYRLDWQLRLGPGFTATLELTGRDNENLEVHATCCWRIDDHGVQCVAINDGFDATARLPVVRCAQIEDPRLPNTSVRYGSFVVEIFIDEKIQKLKQLTDDMGSIYKSQRFSDVTLVTGDREFQVHQLILTMGSRVFASMFSADRMKQRKRRIELHDLESDVLDRLLSFIYTGRPPSDEYEKWSKLLVAADRFAMNDLKDFCVDAMTRTLCAENAADILVAADIVDVQQLRQRALNFIQQNRERVNRLLAGDCENCRVTVSQNNDGSSITKFNYEFCLQPIATGFIGKTPLFSTGQTDSKLDWLLEFGPDFRLNLHLLRWDGSYNVNVHVVCCWKLPFVEEGCTAINENLDPRLTLPSFWSVRLPVNPGTDYISQWTDYDSKVLLDISMENRDNGRTKHLRQYLASALEDGRFSDVTLVACGYKFLAHRVILSQRCPSILGDLGENSDQVIFLHEIDPGVLGMVLEFLYTGRLKNVEESRLDALLTTAFKWSLSDLQHLCVDLIKRRNTRESRQGISVARNGNNIVTLPVDILN